MRYGAELPAQFAELRMPSGDPRGVAVLVHGGFWKPEYGIEYARPLVPSLVERGWATWAIEYRRGTGAADTLADVRAAIDALPVSADTVVGIGHSAGGHLATWAAAGGGLTHVVSQAGVLDLRAAYDENLGGGAVERFLGHPPGPADDRPRPDPDATARRAGLVRARPRRRRRPDQPVAVVRRGRRAVPPSWSRSTATTSSVIDPDSDAWARTLEILDRLRR